MTPTAVSRAAIEAAAARIGGWVRTTPTIALQAGELDVDVPVLLKLELFQHTGSFKPRGAFNRILTADVPPSGVIAASGGNHGQAVAYAAMRLGHPAEIFVPESSPSVKVERLKDYGAEVQVVGAYYDDAFEAMQERAHETGALQVHAYDEPEIVAGQATLGRELQDQAPDLDTVLVAVGGGGLIAGVAAWYRGGVRVISVEPASAPTLAAALEAGRPVEVGVSGLAADSLGARQVGSIAFEFAERYLERALLVTDDSIREAQGALWDRLRIVAEPGGAAALAALLSGVYQPRPSERVAALVCGGNANLTFG